MPRNRNNMKTFFKLEIRTPFGVEFNEDVRSITVNAEDGQITILPRHANIVTLIDFSPLVIRRDPAEDEEFLLRSGILNVDHKSNTVYISCMSAKKAFEGVYFEAL